MSDTHVPTHPLVNPEDFDLPTKWAVCPDCKGAGSTSAHLGAFTADDLHELGPEFAEDYRRGLYDRTCGRCKGRTTIKTVDVAYADPKAYAEYESAVIDAHDCDAIQRAEMRFGA